MKIKRIWIPMIGVSLVLVISLVSLVLAQGSSDSGSTVQITQGISESGTDSNPGKVPEISIPQQYQSDQVNAVNAENAATIYFTPQDENTSTTILFLYNTSNVTATVSIETFDLDGLLFINASIAVPPAGLVRVSGDPVATSSTSWGDVILVNFTTTSTYAKMTMPAGVKADGYVVWNDSGTYDPLQIAPTLSLRFSIDPPTVFLPTVQN